MYRSTQKLKRDTDKLKYDISPGMTLKEDKVVHLCVINVHGKSSTRNSKDGRILKELEGKTYNVFFTEQLGSFLRYEN